MSRPQRPEILVGSSVAFCTLAERMEMGVSTLRNCLQQQCWPHFS